MARLWADRLAEVWAEPGRTGSGVVLGDHGILTARHVVEDARGENDVVARVVRPGAVTAAWTPMEIVWEDPDWDLALLLVVDEPEHENWSTPQSPSPSFVTLGTAEEAGCETVGFPDVAFLRTSSGDPVDLVHQSEQAVGTLLPSAMAKRSTASDQPRRVVPFDVDVAHPETTAGWKGITSAAVVLADGRIAGVVVEAAHEQHEHQERRLSVVPVAEALRDSSTFAAALTEILGAPADVEIRDAERFRDVLKKSCLGADRAPLRVADADLGAFGVTRADVPGESPYLDYIERDGDAALRNALVTAEYEGRIVLIVGASAGGKSRSAAEAVRQEAGGRLLLSPRAGRLARLEHLGVEDWGRALVWLDDLERYNEAGAPDTLDWLRDRGALVVATIRETQLASLAPHGDYRDPLGDALADGDRVTEVRWRDWNPDELARVQGHVHDPELTAWVAEGGSPSAWLVAGPQLVKKFDSSRDDEDHPVRYALVRTVLDWYSTGIGQPMPEDLARTLSTVMLGERPRSGEFKKSLKWARRSVVGSGRSVQAILSRVGSGTDLTVHQYLQDADAKGPRSVVADPIWRAALEHAASDSGRSRIGYAAAVNANAPMAYEAWLPLAEQGDVGAMYNLGALLKDDDPVEARRWYERAAAHDHVGAMFGLGVLLNDSDRVEARRSYERAAGHDHAGAMYNLGILLNDSDPVEARRWYERAAAHDHAGAMYNLGVLLEDDDPFEARHWYERAAGHEHTGAMYNLGVLLRDSDPTEARRWWERAADHDHVGAMFGLGLLLEESDPVEARRWYERAAAHDHTDAMYRLGAFLQYDDPDEARGWWERAAEHDHGGAMYNLGILLNDSDPVEARRWYERAAAHDHSGAMFALGVLLEGDDPAEARRWYERAAAYDHAGAMYNLGVLLEGDDLVEARRWWEWAAWHDHAGAMYKLGILLNDSDPTQARRWYERAAAHDHAGAMYNLGILLEDSDPAEARRWYERAAAHDHAGAMYTLGVLLEDSDPAAARRWWERAGERDHAGAMYNLGVLVEDSDPAGARRWWERAGERDHAGAMYNLGVLLEDDDPAEARRWYERAADHEHTGAMYNLGALLKNDDPAEARRWWERAAGHDHTGAMFGLGVLLEDDDPVGGPALVRTGGRARPRRRHVQPRDPARGP